jgi:hypothetical protein
MKAEYDVQRMREALRYNPTTGFCYWRERPISHFKTAGRQSAWNKRFSGLKVGSKFVSHGITYLRITLDYKHYLLHRVIWAILTGETPNEIDHQDGNGENNRFDNLINTDGFGNHKNLRARYNKSLPTGITMSRGKFKVAIAPNGKDIFYGRFDTLSQAEEVRNAAYKEHGFHPNHGSARAV